MRRQFLVAITLSILLPYVIGGCSHSWKDYGGVVTCTNIDKHEYLDSLLDFKTTLSEDVEDKNIEAMTLDIRNSHIPSVNEWIYLPWDDFVYLVDTVKLVNCSVKTVKTLSLFRSLEVLDLSDNHVFDYKFLDTLEELKYLILRQSTFVEESSFYGYLQKYHSMLTLVDLSYGSLAKFTIFNNVKEYELSYNPKLTSIYFYQNLAVRRVNLRGNIRLRSFENIGTGDFLCLNILDLSELGDNFRPDILKNIKVSGEIILRHNNIPDLNEEHFDIKQLLSKRCNEGSDLSIDLSNCNIQNISSGYFSSMNLNIVNLSNNNINNLKGFIFNGSEIDVLDLSNSQVREIGPNIFDYTSINLLNLSHNNIESVEEIFAKIEDIQQLDLSFNPIETLTRHTFRGCHNLKMLNLGNTFVENLGENILSHLRSLRKLTLSITQREDIKSFKNMYVTELTIFNSSSPNLGPEYFKGFPSVRNLEFPHSPIVSASSNSFLSLSKLKQFFTADGKEVSTYRHLDTLTEINLSNQNIKDFESEVKELHLLINLNLSSNSISNIRPESFSSLRHLEVLSLANNQLSDVPLCTFSPLPKLTHLYLDHNQLRLLLPGVFSGLGHLILLDLSHNYLKQTRPHILISTTLTNLKYLFLQGNHLGQEIDVNDDNVRRYEFCHIANQSNLKYIDINDNDWNCDTLIDVVTSFRNNRINYSATNPVCDQPNINGITCKLSI